MIDESFYWKRELSKIARDLRGRKKQRRWPEASFAQIELDVMLGFYMIRKLLEGHKISDSIGKRRFRLPMHRATGKRVTFQNAHRIDTLYDLSRAQTETRTVAFICDQIIHSYIFVPCLGEAGGWDGIVFASDRQKARGVFLLRGLQVISLFESIARNDPAWIRWQINPGTGEERIAVEPHLPVLSGRGDR